MFNFTKNVLQFLLGTAHYQSLQCNFPILIMGVDLFNQFTSTL